MSKRVRYLRKISLAILALAALVVLGVPSSQAVAPVPAPNDRCGPDLPGVDPCDGIGALTVPQATTPGTQTRQCFEFDTTGTTSGPFGVDVVGGFVNDVWFRLAGPHCAGKRIVVNMVGSTYPARAFVVTEGGGFPFFVCDVTCDNIAGNSFFDSDIVLGPAAAYNLTIPASLSGRDFYWLTDGGGSGILRICFTTACP
ncbi:MAG: hypothetical protein HY314_06640 [Acidobacteria bacterium]|nr:hypothetical protein [Acidobacteriota bacterium]